MELAVVGAGHVGLVTGACFASIGHRVWMLDIDRDRIDRLRVGSVPFSEPLLADLVTESVGAGRLTFHVDASEALQDAQVAFICVGTPTSEDGSVDITSLRLAAEAIADHASDGALLVNRSTAPIGTAVYLRSLVKERRGDGLGIAVNPEFLAEGTAVHDFLCPDRIVIGSWDHSAAELVTDAYRPIIERIPSSLPAGTTSAGASHVPVLITDPPTAELSKYAANAFLAMKISFVNEMAGIAEELGADVTQMATAIGLDRRIGSAFLRAGIGWGGSCFPKDIAALRGMAESRGLNVRMLRAAHDVNADQGRWVMRKLGYHLGELTGRHIGLLGLAFKPGTDDLRNAPALEIAAHLLESGALISAYDPAVKELPLHLAGIVILKDDALAVARGADALVLVTEWPEFESLDLAALRGEMRGDVLIDGRNLLDPATAATAGFTYVGVGR